MVKTITLTIAFAKAKKKPKTFFSHKKEFVLGL